MLASDLHRHLDGSLRAETLVELSRECGSLPAGADAEAFVRGMEFEPGMSLASCLARFEGTIEVLQSVPAIERVARELVLDCHADGVRHVEVRACPALHRRRGLSCETVVEAVLAGLKRGGDETVSSPEGGATSARLIVAVLEGMSEEEAGALVDLAARFAGRGVVGVDLAGNEALFDPTRYAGAFARARSAGLGVTVHAGEGHDAGHVTAAVSELGADRIGHGVGAASDPEAMALLRDRDVTVEICLSSNLHTGAVSSLSEHPLASLAAGGVPVALATDNTFFSGTCLSREYVLAAERAHAPSHVIRASAIRSADAAFLPDEDRARLRALYQAALNEDDRGREH